MAVTRDSTSGVYVPASADECDELFAGLGIPTPTSGYGFQETSGNPKDFIGTKHLTATGTLAHGSVVSGWSRKSIRTTAGVAGTMANAAYANVNANSHTVLLIAATSTVATTRTLFRLGDTFDDDACLELTSTPRLQVGEGDGTRSIGTTNPTGAPRYFFLRVDDAGNQVDGFLDATKIVGGTQACNGTNLTFGGDNAQTWFPNTTDYMYALAWSSALTDQQIAMVVDRLNNGPPSTIRTKTVYYPFTTLVGTLATDTTLAASARHEFAQITLTIPETAFRGFASVRAIVTYRDAFTAATDITGWRMGIKLGAVAFADTDRSFTQANTGNGMWDLVGLDVTEYFNTNFGTGQTQTCQLAFAASTSAVGSLVGVGGLLAVTYEFEDEVSDIVKTGGVSGNYDAQAYSTETWAGGVSVEWTALTASGDAYAIGLSLDNPNADYTGIDRALVLDSGTLFQSENGSLTNLGAYANGDKFCVHREASNVVRYYKNGALIATGANLTGSVLVDSSFRFSSDRASDVIVRSNSLPQRVTWNTVNTTIEQFRAKSIPIPIQSLKTQLTTAHQEIGVDGTDSPAPANQIPALDTYLEESDKSYLAAWVDIEMKVGTSGTNDATPFVQIDATAESTGPLWEGAIPAATNMLWRYTYATGTHATNAAHAFKMRSDVNSRISFCCSILWLTYRYNKKTTTRVTNFIECPLLDPNESDAGGHYGASPTGNEPAAAVRKVADLTITEPGTITLKQSGVLVPMNVRSSAANIKIGCGDQAVREYTPLNSIGFAPFFQRGDHSGGWAIARGRNRLTVTWYSMTERRSTLSGVAWVVYSSDIPTAGGEACSRVTEFVNREFNDGTLNATVVLAASGVGQRTPYVGSTYYLHSVSGVFAARAGQNNTFTQLLYVGSNSDEMDGDNFLPIGPSPNMVTPLPGSELNTERSLLPLTPYFNRSSLHTGKLKINSPRRYALQNGNVTANFAYTTRVCFHNLGFTFSGIVTDRGVPVADGKVIEIFAEEQTRVPPRLRSVGAAAAGLGAITPVMPHHAKDTVALLVITTKGEEAEPTLSTTAGFARIGSFVDTTATVGVRVTLFWVRCASAANGDPTVADGGDHQHAVIVCFDGCIPTGNPWNVFTGNDTTVSGSSTSVVIPGPTTTVDQTMLVLVVGSGADRSADGWANANLVSGPWERFDALTTLGNDSSIAIATGVKRTAGGVTNTTATLSAAARQARFAIALRGLDPEKKTERITSVLTTGGTGSFSAVVPDNTRNYYASYENNNKYGRSASGTPGAGAFNIAIGGDPVTPIYSSYPNTAVEMNAAVGFGSSWTEGWLFDEEDPGANDVNPAFGGQLFQGTTDTADLDGFLAGTDRAFGFIDGGVQSLVHENATTLGVAAADDLLIAGMFKFRTTTAEGDVIRYGDGALASGIGWHLSFDGTNLNFVMRDENAVVSSCTLDLTGVLDRWMAVMVVLDRAADLLRLAVAVDTGTGTLVSISDSGANVATLVGFVDAATLTVGASPAVDSAAFECSAIYFGKGVASAGTAATNILDAVKNFYNKIIDEDDGSGGGGTVTPPRVGSPFIR